MTPSAEQLEERLRRVLDDAANQLHVDTPSPRSVDSTRGARQHGSAVGRLWLPSLGGVLAAAAVLAAVCVALGAIALLGNRRQASPPAAAISRLAPANGIEGSKAALLARVRSLRGHPIVVTVWASWCQPCQRQVGLIARAARKYGHQVSFLGVTADDTRSAAVSFLRTHPLGFPSFQATLDLRPLLSRALPGIPVTLYMSPDGQPAEVHIGEYASFATLAHDIEAVSLHTRSASPSNGTSLWYGAPDDQPGAWREGGATVCPLAPRNRYLPARAGCVSVGYGDVVGDGETDLILLYAVLSTRPGTGGYPAKGFTLEVRRPNGATLRTPIRNAESAPTIVGGRDVNNTRGQELFIREAAISSGQTAGVYTFDGNAIRHVGDFSYGGDSALVQGFSCHLGSPPTITQRVYRLEGPSRSGVWQRTDTTYTWVGAALRRTAQRTTRTHSIPTGSQQQADC